MKCVGKLTPLFAARFLALFAAGLLVLPGMGCRKAGESAAQAPGREKVTTGPAEAPAPLVTAPPTSGGLPETPVSPVRAVHVFVSGRVQGVGFRDWTRREAQALKLTGWVRNLNDGRVEAVFEGPADKVGAVLEKIKTGPSTARVEGVEVNDQAPTGEFKDFERR
jgi:acylphosphatase